MFLFLLLNYYEEKTNNETNTTYIFNIKGLEDEYFAIDLDEEDTKSISKKIYTELISNIIALGLLIIGASLGLFLKRLYNRYFP
jgi:hypothetical protein